jgi:hypothetical protein
MRGLFGYIKRALQPSPGATEQVYVPMTTNALNTINGAGFMVSNPIGVTNHPLGLNPNARALNTVTINNQIPGQVVTQGLFRNTPGRNL